jgi:predicted RNA-binding Zn-ribbon protein involved in translation (DUF1610 family)
MNNYYNQTVSLSLEKDFETLLCPYCGNETLMFLVHRGRNEYDEEYKEIWGNLRADYCPRCGHALKD